MQLYWDCMAGRVTLEGVDQEVERQLASMDPTAGEDHAFGDTLLAAFFFWGGLYIALADGVLHPSELERLLSVAPSGVDVAQLAATEAVAGQACLERFREAIAQRRRRLSAVELHRIVEGLIDVASADGRVEPAEVARLYDLGHALGLSSQACDLLIAKTTRG